MAVPRIFVSSTFYDLRQVRNNIGDFIKSLGYEPVMHERSGVAYTQNVPLENDCYSEIINCDIVVCIIGNHFGSKSSENDLSITMNELESAIKNKKKIYIFIAKDVYIENKTYIQNRDSGSFQSAYADDLKIHEFIYELTSKTPNNVIEPFETTDQIIYTLKMQFAGLFQNLLSRESSLTESKTAYDLQKTADNIKSLIGIFDEQKEEFFNIFNSTILAVNNTSYLIKKHLGMNLSSFFVRNLAALDEFMQLMGFKITEADNPADEIRKYIYEDEKKTKTLVLKHKLFDSDGNLKDIRTRDVLEKAILWEEHNVSEDLF